MVTSDNWPYVQKESLPEFGNLKLLRLPAWDPDSIQKQRFKPLHFTNVIIRDTRTVQVMYSNWKKFWIRYVDSLFNCDNNFDDVTEQFQNGFLQDYWSPF